MCVPGGLVAGGRWRRPRGCWLKTDYGPAFTARRLAVIFKQKYREYQKGANYLGGAGKP